MKRRKSSLIAAGLLASTLAGEAAACDTDVLIGSVCVFGFNFCPRGFAEANGQLLAISANTALFSLLGTFYGGDGRTTFALPDLRGRVMIGDGQGPGLTNIPIGSRSGSETVTLSQNQLPAHTHTGALQVSNANGDADDPTGAVPARMPRNRVYSGGAPTGTTAVGSVEVSGGGSGQAVPVRDPYLGVKVCIATIGVFPSRN